VKTSNTTRSIRQLALACAVLATPACAGRFVHLDPSAAPNYATVEVGPGFEARSVDVVAGGEIQAASLPTLDGRECEARNIDDQPDVRLVLRSTQSLHIAVEGDGQDTTLALHGPGGFLCDDDSAGGDDPAIDLNAAPAGRYEIWVGSYLPGHYPHVRLVISPAGR